MALDLYIFEENKNIMFLEIIINEEGMFEDFFTILMISIL